MDALPSSQLPDDLAQRFSTAIAAVDAAVERAGLRRDPYGELMAAQAALASLSIPVLQRFEAAAERGRAPIADEDMRRLERTLGAGVFDQVSRAVRGMDRRTLVLAMLGGLAGVCVVGCAGYWQGHWAGYVDGAAAGRSANAVIAAMPAAEGRAWEELIRDNLVIAPSLAECRSRAKLQGDKLACDLPIWIEPPKPATQGK